MSVENVGLFLLATVLLIDLLRLNCHQQHTEVKNGLGFFNREVLLARLIQMLGKNLAKFGMKSAELGQNKNSI